MLPPGHWKSWGVEGKWETQELGVLQLSRTLLEGQRAPTVLRVWRVQGSPLQSSPYTEVSTPFCLYLFGNSIRLGLKLTPFRRCDLHLNHTSNKRHLRCEGTVIWAGNCVSIEAPSWVFNHKLKCLPSILISESSRVNSVAEFLRRFPTEYPWLDVTSHLRMDILVCLVYIEADHIQTSSDNPVYTSWLLPPRTKCNCV